MTKKNINNVLALIYAGANIDAVNNEGNTALHIAMAQAERPYDDDSWLHYLNFWSHSTPDVHIVEVLLVFDADTSILNKKGLTPWSVGMEAWNSSETEMKKKALKDVLFAMHEVGCHGAEEPSKDFFDKQRQREDIHRDNRHRSVLDKLLENVTHEIDSNREDPRHPHSYPCSRLLSLDGGGIRDPIL